NAVAARLGGCEARCGRVGLKGAAVRATQATQALQGVSEANDRSAQRACVALTAGALEVFTVDIPSAVYK
ncbi:hypothetical protein, partial [Halorubrum yunnanense]